MTQTHSQIYIHIVFSTKERIKFIHPLIEKQLHNYIFVVCENLDCPVFAINGMEDHIHILLSLSRSITISKLVETIKSSSSKWIKTLKSELNTFAWQKGYGVFSVDRNTFDRVSEYILKQKEHHKIRDFKQEYLLFLKKFNINYDEKYLWD